MYIFSCTFQRTLVEKIWHGAKPEIGFPAFKISPLRSFLLKICQTAIRNIKQLSKFKISIRQKNASQKFSIHEYQ